LVGATFAGDSKQPDYVSVLSILAQKLPLFSVVLPVVDLIQPLNFEYSQSMVAKGGFDWVSAKKHYLQKHLFNF
jgi:hypothetical protein